MIRKRLFAAAVIAFAGAIIPLTIKADLGMV